MNQVLRSLACRQTYSLIGTSL